MKGLLNEGGVVVYNISTSDKLFFKLCERQFKGVFKNVLSQSTKDLNMAFIASEREIIGFEEVNEKRTGRISMVVLMV